MQDGQFNVFFRQSKINQDYTTQQSMNSLVQEKQLLGLFHHSRSLLNAEMCKVVPSVNDLLKECVRIPPQSDYQAWPKQADCIPNALGVGSIVCIGQMLMQRCVSSEGPQAAKRSAFILTRRFL
jgi:hypothetical protein